MTNMLKRVSLSVFLTGTAVLFGGVPARAAGGETFKAKCVACHGPDGSGSTPIGKNMKVRDLRSAEVQKQTDDEIAAQITNGKPPMPAYGKTLKPTEIQEIVSYLRSIARKS